MEFLIHWFSLHFWSYYAAYGLGYVIDINGWYSFNFREDIVCQDILYYVLKSVTD